MTVKENWVQTDESDDVAGSIRQVIRCLHITDKDCQAWKWACLALHSALQGASVCHLVTTASPVGVVTKKNAGEWVTYFEASRTGKNARVPKTYLMTLPDLLKAARKPNSAGDRSNPNGVLISDNELRWLKRFHDKIRNQFIHFEPMGWSIDVSGVRSLAVLVARIIREIAHVGWAFRHKDQEWKQSLSADLAYLSALA